MSLVEHQYVVGRAGSVAYEPLIIDGVRVGEEHSLRSVGSHGNQHEAALWRTDAPARYEYVFSGDESFYVLEGSASIELVESGERIDVKTGDVASFNRGTRSVWTFTEPFTKFTVISG